MQCQQPTLSQMTMDRQRMQMKMTEDSQILSDTHTSTAHRQYHANGDNHASASAEANEMDVSGPHGAIDEELRCRYSNKKCPNPRTEKRTGGLHAFCEEHRENANRNQRKLDSKKRVERRQHQSIVSYYETIQAAHQLDPSLAVALPAPIAAAVEPYPRPIGLLDEDVNELVSLFGEPDLGESKFDGANEFAF